MKLLVKKDSTSKLVQFFVQDTSKSDGSGLTGLAFGTGSLTCYYYREGAGSAVQISLLTMTLGSWTTCGFIVVDGTNLPGIYQLGIPDAALATGANSVVIMLKGATNMAPVLLEIQLVDFDPQDAIRLGLTASVSTARPIGSVVADGSNSATTFKTDRTEATTDYWKDCLLLFTSGALAGQVKKVSGYNGSTKFVTVGAFTAAPSAADTFVLINA